VQHVNTTQRMPEAVATDQGYRIVTAIVSAVEGDKFWTVEAIPQLALRAASCVTVPQVGDTVLLARSESDFWIIAVLASTGSRECNLQASQVTVSADTISMASQTLHTSSQAWRAEHLELVLSATSMHARVGALDWLGEKVTSWIDWVFSRQRRVMREVAEIESVQCGTFHLQADNTLCMNAQTSLLTAHGMMKIDAAQIHLG